MKKELPKIYLPKDVELNKYESWNKKGYFRPQGNGQPFCIILPPPNVTGVLHIGHALDVALQDVMIRYKKLQGFKTLWVPGTDHAGIATQTKFEAYLRQKNVNKNDLGKQEFLSQLMEWKDVQTRSIHEQWAKLGLALDYNEEKFTMDSCVQQAVEKVFVDLYNNKLIYRGKKLVNWDVELQTAISDIEVIHKQVRTKLYYVKYYLDKKFKSFLEVATSRPETMFGDVCLFVNPLDKRYKKFIGSQAYNPATRNWMPILADRSIEIDFGTGVMKCTPAHDFHDYELAQKYQLEMINILNADGTMNDKCPKYIGMDRLKCRTVFVNTLVRDKYITKIDDKYDTKIGYSERSQAIVEPYLSDQWFLKMQPLAQKVLTNQKNKGESTATKFYPKHLEKSLNHWLLNIEDWCISRQLWWGHQLPIWYHNKTQEVFVGTQPPLNAKEWTRDPDVLDTWFSSGLWPMVALGWPKQNKLLTSFFPTSILVTGYDILTFWVSRMMMLSTYFTDKTPFEKVYIHGLIRDEKGQKMSKSLGNGIEPMKVIEQYGADTLRLFLTCSSTIGEDLNYSDQKLKSNWGFLNKLWNTARFILLHSDGPVTKLKINTKSPKLCLWILTRFNKMLTQTTKYMNDYNFVVSTRYLTDFIWNDFCSVFLELSKVVINNKQCCDDIIATMLYILKNVLIMLHPQCPFITEEIYQMLPQAKPSIMKETWPEKLKDIPKENRINTLVEIIYIIRKVRLDNKIGNNETLIINLLIKDNLKRFERIKDFLNAYLIAVNTSIKNISSIPIVGHKITEIGTNFILEIPFEKNQTNEIDKITKLIKQLNSEVKRSKSILENNDFITKAPKSKIDIEKEKLIKYQQQLQAAKASLKNLK